MSAPAGRNPGEGPDDESPLQVIGQLAGGIAHDFNNILGVIINYARFASASVPPGSPAAADIEEIRRAAERGVGLVRQLMILARRESGSTVAFDLNELISGLDGFLRSTIGEHIAVERHLDPALWPLTDDPARIEQILINLAVNSRDAMPGGGTLSFETGNAELGSTDTLGYPGVEPGRFVRLLVSDTGIGMDAEVASRAFEPMFTTKASGQGTGLGLATVYTIVTQAGGHDRPLLESRARAPASRSTFPPARRTRGPAAEAVAGGSGRPRRSRPDRRGRRGRPPRRRANPRAPPATTSPRAPAASRHWSCSTTRAAASTSCSPTWSCPGCGATTSPGRAVAMRPGLHVLFMSGYSDDAPPSDLGPTAGRVSFIDKPFDAGALLERLRELLGA